LSRWTGVVLQRSIMGIDQGISRDVVFKFSNNSEFRPT
jgi:hypothetical protein